MRPIGLKERLVGGVGSRLVSAGAEVKGLRCYAMIPREESTITSVTGVNSKGDTVDVLALWGIAGGGTVYANELRVTPIDVIITDIQVATGTVRMN